MDTINLSLLTSAALKESGCDSTMIEMLGDNINIVLELNILPSINISFENDKDVWLWSLLGEYSAKIIPQRGAELLQALMKGCDFSRCKQFQLAIQDGELVLKALVHPHYLTDGRAFSIALNAFYDELNYFYGVFLR